MKITKKNSSFLVEGFFSHRIIAGFSSSDSSGKLPDDIDKIFSFLDKNISVAYMDQRHSSEVSLVNSPGLYEADGIFSRLSDSALLVKTADCLPIFLSSSKLGIIGVIHMGWRSAERGILDNIPYDLNSFKIIAGAGLRCCCYGVGDEFLGYSQLSGHLTRRGKKVYFDPISFLKQKAFSRGLKKENFLDLDICSFCSKYNLFSYRKSKSDNRTISFIFNTQ